MTDTDMAVNTSDAANAADVAVNTSDVAAAADAAADVAVNTSDAAANVAVNTSDAAADAVAVYDEAIALWANEDIRDAEEILREMVAGLLLTPDQFVSITGLPYEEDTESLIAPEGAAPIEETTAEAAEAAPAEQPSLSLSPYITMKIALEERLATGRLNAAGAMAELNIKLMRKELSSADFDKLSSWLASVSEGKISQNNAPNDADIIKEDIREHYHAFYSDFEAAKTEGGEIILSVIKESSEFEGTKANRLVRLFADFAAREVAAGNLIPRFRLVTNPETKKTAKYALLHTSLWGRIREAKLLGEPSGEQIEQVGERKRVMGYKFNPYTDPSIVKLTRTLCMKACLLVYRHKSHVRFGYVQKKLKGPMRVSRGLVFLDQIPQGQDAKDFYEYVCVPANILTPCHWDIGTRKDVTVNKDGNPTETLFTVLKRGEINEDTTLRWLPDEAIEPLYQIAFADHEPVFAVEERGVKKLPLGTLSDSRHPDEARQREGKKEDTNTIPQAVPQAIQLEQLRKTLGERGQEISKEHMVPALQAFDALMKMSSVKVTQSQGAHIEQLFFDWLNRRFPDIGEPDRVVLGSLVRIHKLMLKHIDWDDQSAEWIIYSGKNNTGKQFRYLENKSEMA